MARRIEIQPAPHGLAYVETYIDDRLTHRTEAMAVAAARLRAQTYGSNVTDHTSKERPPCGS